MTDDQTRPPGRLLRNLNAKIASLPMILTATVVFLGGTIWTVVYSFTNSKLLPRLKFVGLDQYERLWAAPRWLVSIENLAIYGVLSLIDGERTVLTTDFHGRLTDVAFERGRFSCVLDGSPADGAFLALHHTGPSDVVAARLDDRTLAALPAGDGARFDLTGAVAGARLSIWHLPAPETVA